MAGLTLAGMMYGSFADFLPNRQEADVNAIILFWSGYNVIVLLLAIAVCVELPQYRREERFSTSESVQVFAGGREFSASLADLSILGARIAAPPPEQIQELVRIRLDDVGEIAGRIVHRSGRHFAIEFVGHDHLHDRLIRKLFSGRYDRQMQEVSWRGLWSALVARVMR
jgi:cellulose synthase (UDP-forming)